ncbi:FtsK/SpoIIIE family protein [Leptotrichia sp. oral taxon 215 str. W9775]|uniref:DNA translocase FtsK n=1 Tax=Leptotrichia sp. oral taxon 215 TaxID=712359 RepID=UPI0003AE0F98|nr:DNA translocase FtsK [Leptotrichia sp. oral taxon 215]ERK68738.1 FtsK/SpoIIIE family protein [Leptotrichia sp. oral taxon 215 str. W9775]
MNKKVKGISFIVLGMFLTYLLVNRRGIETSNNSEGNFLFLFLNFFTLIAGKMGWIIIGLVFVAGLAYLIKKEVKISRKKELTGAICLLAISLLFIREDIVTPLPDSFTDAGRIILELGFGRESGGIVGSLVAMPLYKIIATTVMGIFLWAVVGLSIVYLLSTPLEYIYEWIKGVRQYYRSDEYKEKATLLKAKKMSEKLKRTDYKKYQKEEMKKRIIESRNQKLSFELAKKPKDSFLDKTEVYSDEELAKKEKEWTEFSKKMENDKVAAEKEKVAVKSERKPENSKVEEKKTEVKKQEEQQVKTAEKPELQKTVAENTKVSQENNTPEVKIPENKETLQNSQVNVKPSAEKELQKEVKTAVSEEIKSAGDKTVKKENKKVENHHEEMVIPKIEAFEDVEAIKRQKELEENLKKAEAARLNTDKGYNELLKKSIEEIFKIKPMDMEKKFEIEKSIIDNVNHLENVLKQFGIDAKVVNYEYGPTITRYEITIPAGVKVSKVTSLSDDIAMNLAAESIRIEAPIPGKNTIGIETPNKIKEPVHFSNIIQNKELEKGELNVILGKDIVGRDKIIDITKMPHLLIAGQTGSGKSVAVNTLIATLISKKSEKEVKFIMVDPKMVELMPYNDIPHLLVPVIIDPQQAAIALKWAVNEMENRYKQLMENGVRNIKSYNSLKYVEKMPYIVIIIDELADLMMVASGSVEESIARIAQKARAVGIHLVVATQRPSTDVITGMIKANLPSRISFALRSQIDSRTILDSAGAEKLLGQGDMLLLENGSSKLERIQGAFISDEEVTNLTSMLKSSRKVKYRDEILVETQENDVNVDPYFENAIEIIKQEKKVSISLLQRELRIGFNRASRIYDQLKEKGIISYDNQILIDDDLENEIKK